MNIKFENLRLIKKENNPFKEPMQSKEVKEIKSNIRLVGNVSKEKFVNRISFMKKGEKAKIHIKLGYHIENSKSKNKFNQTRVIKKTICEQFIFNYNNPEAINKL